MSIVPLSFNNVDLTVIDNNDGQIWVTSSELARALEYKTTDSVTRLFNRYSDEFTESMSQTLVVTEAVNLDQPKTSGQLGVTTRIFSLRGCHLLAMFARTDVAKEFRVWALNVLDNEAGKPKGYHLGDLQELRDLAAARYALGFSVASDGGKALSNWRNEKQALDAEMAVLDNLMQPLLTGFDDAKVLEVVK